MQRLLPRHENDKKTMKTFTQLAALAALAFALVTAPAHAQVLKLKPSVEHIDDVPTYLAALWPNERVNFYNSEVFAIFDGGNAFQDFWVFDLNNDGTLVVTLAAKTLQSPAAYWADYLAIYPDAGSTCEPSRWCNDLYFQYLAPLGYVRLPEFTFVPRKVSLRMENIPAGRYVMRIAGVTGLRRASYTGQLTLRN